MPRACNGHRPNIDQVINSNRNLKSNYYHEFLSFQIGLKTPKLMQLEVKIGFSLTTLSKDSKDSHNEGSSFP